MSERTHPMASITQTAAASLIAATMEAARRIGFEPVVAITDVAGNLKAFERSDRSSYLAVHIAIDKAYTAASFGLATHEWVGLTEDHNSANLKLVPRVIAVAGGFPIKVDGMVVGGLGISGGDYKQDQQAGEDALRDQRY